MSKFLRFLLSRAVAIALMLAMAAFLALASLVPARDLAPERLADLRRTRPIVSFLVERFRPEETARSPVFIGLAALVFVSTAWSIVERVRLEAWRRRTRPAAQLERFRTRLTLEVAPAGDPVEPIRTVLRRGGHRVEEEGEPGGARALVATRGAAGFAGSIVFHVGILVTMAAVAVSARTRFNGELLLVEGVAQPVQPGVIFNATRPEMIRELAGWAVGIRDFRAEYDRGYGQLDFAALFDVSERGAPTRTEVVRVNQPVALGDFQVTLYRYGFAPELTVRRGPAALADGLAILRVIPPGTEDALPLEDGSALHVALWPDHARRGGRDVSRTMNPVHPVLTVRHVADGVELARGQVALRETARVGPLEVSFPGLRYWADFQVGRDGGVPWFALGTALVAAGLGLRFLHDPRTIRVTLRPEGDRVSVEIVSSARYFPALDRERARRLAASIEGALRRPGKAAA